MSDIGSANSPIPPNAFSIANTQPATGNAPHFPNASIFPSSAPTKPPQSPVVEQIGSLETLLHHEIEKDRSSTKRIPLSIVIASGQATSIATAIEEVLGIEVELILIGDSKECANVPKTGSQTTVRVITPPHRMRLVGSWYAASQSQGDVVAFFGDGVQYENPLTPLDCLRWMAPIQLGLADVVYVSRFLDAAAPDLAWFDPTRWGRWLSNRCTGFELTDVATPIKFFRRSALMEVAPRERGALIDMEILARLSQAKVRVSEVAIPGTNAPRPSVRSWSHLLGAIKYSAVSRWTR